ncbi:MAG: glycosyl hydrolase [Candidatus Micrarchaeaceae archaeon]
MNKAKIAGASLALAFAIIIALVILADLTQRATALPAHLNYTLGIGTHGNETSELKALKSGIKYFRTDITLSPEQTQLIDYEHAHYNANYLGILDYETVPNGFANKNWNLTEWNESVANAVTTFPYINTWEIWNEPLVAQFQTGFMNGSAYNYFLIIKSAAEEIRSKQPNATIVCFGGAPINNAQAFYWYAQVWQYGAARYCNAISVHAYLPGPLLPGENFTASWIAGLGMYENLTHEPIYVTEFGMPSSSKLIPGYSPSMQNEFMKEALSLFAKEPYVKAAYWYDLWGLSDGALGNDYGLLNLTEPVNGTQEPAWYTFLKAESLSNN